MEAIYINDVHQRVALVIRVPAQHVMIDRINYNIPMCWQEDKLGVKYH